MAKEFASVNLSKPNKKWLEQERDRIARAASYPRLVSLDEAFTALRTATEQRQKLTQKGKL